MATKKAETQMEMEKMEGRKIQSETETEPCWKKKAANEGFFTNVKEHFDEFVNTSMDQHKICLKKTIEGASSRFRRSTSQLGLKAENDLDAKEVKSSK